MFKYYMEAYGSGGHELCNALLETCDGLPLLSPDLLAHVL